MIYYKLNSYVFVRQINNYLQIVDKRDDSELIGDYTSYLFVKYLGYNPSEIDCIVNQIQGEFSGEVDVSIVKNDAIRLFDRLTDFGLVSKCNQKDGFAEECSKKTEKQKILLSDNDFQLFKEQLKKHPQLLNIIVEITQQCNERCVHCYIPHENKRKIMSDDVFYKIVDECAEMQTVVNFKITGGECMTHPSFKKFVKYVKDKGFALSVLTNLTLLDDETVDILKQGTLSNVQISMFSVNAEIHDKITNLRGSLERTLKNVEKLRQAGIPVSIATQAMEINKDEIEGLFQYANGHNCNLRCDWTIIAKEDRNSENLSYRICDLQNYKRICKTRLKYTVGYADELRKDLSREPKPETTHLCNAGTNGLYIDTTLKVHPCPGWDLTVGDLNEESLSHIWQNSATLQKVRDVVLKDFPKCAKCGIRNLCSICMAQADIEMTANNFTFEMPEYMCNMYRIIYDTIQKEVLEK